jgi:hypothetical protein
MQNILDIQNLIYEIEDSEFTQEELNIINERLDFKAAVRKTGTVSLKGIKSFVNTTFKGLKGVNSWINYLYSIERYTILIRDTEDRLKANTNDYRAIQLKSKLDKYRYKLKRIQLKEQSKKADFIASTEVKIKKLEDLKQSDPDSDDISELESEVENRKRFLSKIGYSI